jgi:hypothetical protein
MRYVVSAVRFAYDGRPISNTRPMLNWLNALGEGPYNRATPDGYPLGELNWASPGQISRRFEIARAIGSGNAGLFDPEDGTTATSSGFPAAFEPPVFRGARAVPGARHARRARRANSQQEWNTFLLSSPDFNYE